MKRLPLRACQCGVVAPAWMGAGRGGEKLRCLGCGNETGAGRSRERLAAEWNSAGWCGQSEAAPEIKPFGPEWRAQTMRLKKADLVAVYEMRLRAGLVLAKTVREQRALIDRLRVRRGRREIYAVIDRLVQRGIVAKADAAGAKKRAAQEVGS